MRQMLTAAQGPSFANNREYCGYIGVTVEGKLAASQPTPGREATCTANDPMELDLILASYHTHGAFSTEYFNEIPSPTDIYGDAEEGINGYVATPGGRLWFVDGEAMTVSQICGLGCLPVDPDFIPGDNGEVAEIYTIEEIEILFDE